MVLYSCEKCGYYTTRKKDKERHDNRINPCEPKFKCSTCDFVTIYKDKFDEHIEVCSVTILARIKIEQEKQKLVNLKLKNNKLMLHGGQTQAQGQNFVQNNSQTITQNNLNQNNSFQFTLNPWTSPDMNHITNIHYYECFTPKEDAMLKFTKMLYLDPKVPQNHSIHIDKNKKIMAYRDDKTWCPKDDDFVEDLIDSNDRYMDRWSIDNEDNEEFKDARKLYRETRDIMSNNLENIKLSIIDEFIANKAMICETSKLNKKQGT